MRFTKQYALTFGMGLVAALLIVLGEALILHATIRRGGSRSWP